MDDFDLDDYRPADEPRPMHVMNPKTGQLAYRNGEPVEIMVLGPESEKMRKHLARVNNRRLQAASRTGKVSMTAEQVEQEALDRAVAATADWRNITRNGMPVPFSPEEVRKLYSEVRWLAGQVNDFFADEGNFLGASQATTASPS